MYLNVAYSTSLGTTDCKVICLNELVPFLANVGSFKVKAGNSYSTQQHVLSGVPQDSVLGLLLFVIYTAYITSQLKPKCVMYVNDIKIYNNSFI